MITQCEPCGQLIRDCSVPAGGRYVTGWYHTATGYETCAGGTMARPVKQVSVKCPAHRRPVEHCLLCVTSAEVSLYFHNAGRCIARLCPWPHS